MTGGAVVIDDFVARLPKAELHMHIEGSIEAEMMFALAARHGIALRWPDIDALRAAYDFADLQGFLDLYYDGCRVLLDAQDFYEVTHAYLVRAHQDGVLHAEMFLGPQSHTARGVSMATQMDGVWQAMRDAERTLGITSALLVSAQRHRSEQEALALLDQCLPWAERIAAFGLGGAEIGHPPSKFERFFARCREAGFKTTIHAGEEGPADYVRQSIDLLQVDRIDHGNACMDDAALVADLVARRIPLTVCPLSNLALRVVPSLAAHPIRQMLDAGLCVTMNSDDPSYFGGYVNANYRQCQAALGLSKQAMLQLARNSFEAAFMPTAARTAALGRLEAFAAAEGLASGGGRQPGEAGA